MLSLIAEPKIIIKGKDYLSLRQMIKANDSSPSKDFCFVGLYSREYPNSFHVNSISIPEQNVYTTFTMPFYVIERFTAELEKDENDILIDQLILGVCRTTDVDFSRKEFLEIANKINSRWVILINNMPSGVTYHAIDKEKNVVYNKIKCVIDWSDMIDMNEIETLMGERLKSTVVTTTTAGYKHPTAVKESIETKSPTIIASENPKISELV